MSRFVSKNGVIKYSPGALSEIDVSSAIQVGVTASGIVALIGEADGGEPGKVFTIDDPSLAKRLFRSGPLADATRIAFDPSADFDINGGASRVLAYKVNSSKQSTLQLPGDEALVSDTAASGSTSTVINLTNGGLTEDAHIGRWFEIPGLSERRRIVDNDASSVTVEPAFSSAPASSEPVNILESQVVLTSKDYGLHTEQISVEVEPGTDANKRVITVGFEDSIEQSSEIAGDAFLRVKYVGGPVVDSGSVTSISSDGLTVTVDVSAAPTSDAWAGMVLQFDDGTQRLISGNTAADPVDITLDSGHALDSDQQSDLVGATATVRNVTAATADISGANGKATTFSTTVTPTADDITLTFNTDETLRSFVDRVNSETNFEASIPDGVNPDTTLMETFDFGTRATGVDVRFDEDIDPDNKGSFRRDLQVLVDWFNDFSDLVSAKRAVTGSGEGSELPLNTGGVASATRDIPIYLKGGTRGSSKNSDWQTGFDKLLEVRANHIVPLASEDLSNEGHGSTATYASIAAQLKSHVQEARGAGQTERGGYLGIKGSLSDIRARASNMNDTDVQLFPQQIEVLDVNSNLKKMPEWAQAVAAAGMRAGAPEIGTPLTFKLLKTNSLDQDSSWSPKNKTDVNSLIKAGVMFAEEHPNGGFRWVRDITTHVKDDNLALITGSVRDVLRFIAYDLRTSIENNFTGDKGSPATASSIREFVASKMSVYKTDNLIVDSLDPDNPSDTSTVYPGFRKLKVSISGNTARVSVELFPVQEVTFELIDMFVQIPRIVA